MSNKASGGSATNDPSRSSDPWLDLLGEVDAELARLRADTPKRSSDALLAPLFGGKAHKPRAVAPAVPVVLAPPPGMAAAVAPTPKVDPANNVPTGTDLADPKNFGVLPVAAELEMGALTVLEYRQKLRQRIEYANQILHTSGVPAAVWREWRVWEKTAQERLAATGG